MINAAMRKDQEEFIPAVLHKSANTALATAALDPAHRLRCQTYGPMIPMLNVRDSLRKIILLGHDWDGFGAEVPSRAVFESACSFADAAFFEVKRTNYAWTAPNISASENGAYVFEWWYRTRKLTIYVEGNVPEFIKICGPDIHRDMEDGRIDTAGKFEMLWAWLHS